MAVVIAGSLFLLAIIVYSSKWRSVSPVALAYFGCLVLFQSLLEELYLKFFSRFNFRLMGMVMSILIPLLLLLLAYLMLSRIEDDREISKIRIGFNLVISTTFIGIVAYTGWVLIERQPFLIHFLSGYSLIGIYLMANFIVFILVNSLLRLRPVPLDIGVLVVLGSKLDSEGKITPQLRKRLDKAVSIYKQNLTHTHPQSPLTIYVTGGINRADTISESELMAQYLCGQGVSTHDIRLEGESTSTKENLRNVHWMLEKGTGQVTTLIITSHFHLLRSYFYAWLVGMDLSIIGVAGVFWHWPFAVVREFIAFFVLTKELNYIWMIAYLLHGLNEALLVFL